MVKHILQYIGAASVREHAGRLLFPTYAMHISYNQTLRGSELDMV